MSRITIVTLFVCFFIAGCATSGGPQQTQLQIREFQTKAYETNDTKMVMKAVLNVLQDDAFIIKEANTELGFMTAAKEIDVESKGSAFVATLFMGANAKWKKNSIIEATANISEFGTQTRVRMIFQTKTMDNKGGVVEVKQIQEEQYYQDFFAKVDKGIFIEKEKL